MEVSHGELPCMGRSRELPKVGRPRRLQRGPPELLDAQGVELLWLGVQQVVLLLVVQRASIAKSAGSKLQAAALSPASDVHLEWDWLV